MLHIATIGIGNAGNQVSELAMSLYNIPGIAINSSQKDLQTIKKVPKLVMGDNKGAGKNRDEAKRFVKLHAQALLQQEKIINHIEENDLIFVISSIGGGTGSGMAPILTDILSRKFPNKKFVLIEIYPPLAESIAAQQNSIDYLKEVKSFLPNVAYLAYDNNRKSDLTTSEMMRSVNEEIVEALIVFRGDYLYPTPYNSIDEKDMMRFFETPGRMAVYILDDIKEKDFDNKSLEDALIDVIKNKSVNVELDRDKIVKRLGVIANLNPNLNKLFNTNILKVKDLIGEPVESYEHMYVTESKEETNRLILIVSGLSVPDDRLTKLKQRIEEGMEELARNKESSILDDLDTLEIRDLRANTNEAKELDFEDLFSKYES